MPAETTQLELNEAHTLILLGEDESSMYKVPLDPNTREGAAVETRTSAKHDETIVDKSIRALAGGREEEFGSCQHKGPLTGHLKGESKELTEAVKPSTDEDSLIFIYR